MTLRLHRAERADRLAEALAAVLAQPPPGGDPFAAEVVSVPTRGVERWLAQVLSGRLGASPGRGDGVCANVELPFPGRLVGGVVAAAAGVDPDADPWAPERCVWPLLDVVERGLEEGWLGPLAAHIGGAPPGHRPDGDAAADRRQRRFAAVRHVADLFDRYGVHRPAMLARWAEGDDVDAGGGPLPADLAWQAELWRRLRRALAAPSPAERLAAACERIRRHPEAVGLPGRLSLFGLTRLPASYLQVLRALAAGRDVHLFLLHPSPVLWERLAAAPPAAGGVPPRRREDPTSDAARNPLLATWGRDAREMQLVLTGGGDHAGDHHPVADPPPTLLGRLQADVRADRAPPGEPPAGGPEGRARLEPGDRSVQVHACHGRARQVEVVRDAVLHLLADDPTLEPRDVIVMCPDIDAFAPLVHATFGAGDDGDPEARPAAVDLRVRLADRSIRQTNPLLAVVSEVLALAASRVTASQVVDLAAMEPVRRRFGFDDDDLARVEEWVATSGIRWGLDGAHRAPYELAALEANTWRSGLDRILAGVAQSEEGQRLVGGTLPLDDVDSGEVELAGRLAELVDRLHAAVTALSRDQPVTGWADAVATTADALAVAPDDQPWQRAQLQGLLDEVVAEATGDGGRDATELGPGEVRALLADRLRGRPTRANFRTGHLTVCTLVPMRSVPHRVVCLLGLDDGVFPRRTAPDGDDLVERDPRVGDRDPRSEDRQLLLDALLAATGHLVVTYSGRDERTNAARPPAVPVGELLDLVDATVWAADPGGEPVPARDRVVVHHPLQPFDVRNFEPGRLVPAAPWSFDGVALAGARASAGPRSPRPPFLERPLPPVAADLVELDAVVRFVQHPVRAFLRQRLGVAAAGRDQELDDGLPVQLDALEEWSVGQRLLEARLAGAGAEACRAAEAARGSLPPGALGGPVLDKVAAVVERIVAGAEALDPAGAPAGSVEVNVEVGGRALVGTVSGVVGDLARTVTYSRIGAKHRLAAWVRFLALTAAHPERPFRSATVGRGRGRGKVAVATVAPLAGDPASRRRLALEQLAMVLDLHQRGLCQPLPLYCATSAAWAGAAAAGRRPAPPARSAWETTWDRVQEDREPEHQLVLGGVRAFDALLEDRPGDDECGPGWAAGEDTRFGRYARRLWDGLLAGEELTEA